MPRIAWIYIIGALTCASALGCAALAVLPRATAPWGLVLALAGISALLRVVAVPGPDHRAYEGSTIGLFASLLLLPPGLFIVVVVIAHVIEWAWVRGRTPSSPHLRAWYIQPFNMAKCIIGGGGAYAMHTIIAPRTLDLGSSDSLPLVLLIIVVYVLANQLALALVLFLGRGVALQQTGILRDTLLIEMPLASIGYMAVVLLQRGSLLAFLAIGPIALIYQAFHLPKLQDEALRALERVNRDLTCANQSIHQLNDELFLTLAKIFDARDPYVGGHAAQVAAYAVAIATELALPPAQIEIVRQAAYLHDIGKIAIPEAILHKPGTLTEAEYRCLQTHADMGADLIATSQGLRHLARFIRHHHERWDGRGYPNGLAGTAIPLEARILNVCDSVEAMASDRPYHTGMPVNAIIAEVQRCAGTQFDPTVAAIFVRIAQHAGDAFIVNSARAVAAQSRDDRTHGDDLAVTRYAQIYQKTAVFGVSVAMEQKTPVGEIV